MKENLNDWFKYYRSSKDHHLRSRPLVWIYWIHCLESAAWKAHEVFWNEREFILEEGSFITSMERDRLKNGLTLGQVRAARRILAKCNMVNIQTSNHGTLIKICNWKAFQRKPAEDEIPTEQADDNPTTTQQQSNNKPTTTTEEGEEGLRKKRRKRITAAAPEYSPEFEQFWKVYPKHEDKNDAFILYQEIDPTENKKLLQFAFRYAEEYSGNRCKYAKKAKYILRHLEWENWLKENSNQEKAVDNRPPQNEYKPAPTGIRDREAYHLMARNKCPTLKTDQIYKAYSQNIHINQLIEGNL